MTNIQTFVISLPEASERREVMRGRLAAINLPFTFFDAVDGRGFDVPVHPAYDARRRRAFFGKDLTGGELGCLLSHRAVYQKMVDEDIGAALVLEDDAVFKPEFPKVLAAVLECPAPYDLVRFMDKPKLKNVSSKRISKLHCDYELRKFCAIPGGAYAYVITRAGAEKMLRVMQRNYMPVDGVMGHVWLQGLKNYIVWPCVASWDEGQGSYIGDARFDKKSKAARPWYYPLSRLCFKLYEAVAKRLWF